MKTIKFPAKNLVLGLLLLTFSPLLYASSLLEAPQRLSQQEIKAIEQESIKEGWGATWERLLQCNQSITFQWHDGVVEIDLVLHNKLPDYIDDEAKKLFKFSESIKEGKSVPMYFLHIGTPVRQAQTQEKLSEESPSNGPYTISNRRDFSKTPKERNPKTLSMQELGELIRTKRVIFYTGAGISAAAGVLMMQPLMNALGIDSANNCDQFIQDVLANPEKKQQVFAQFCERAFTAQPTPAHKALASIVLVKQTQILTENFDLLHEHAGIKAQHISGPWLKANVKTDELKSIDAVICVALSYDDRGFLGWYKEHNPNGTIVAIDLAKPSYLGNEDFLLQGDCQKLLPELQQEVSRVGTQSELKNTALLHDKLDAYIQAQVNLGQFNGAILIARGDEIILSKGYGYANHEQQVPCTPQTQFCIGSCTKSFTALAIMILQAQNKLNVRDTLDKYFPDFPRSKEITLHHLLTHTSGIVDYTNLPNFDDSCVVKFEQGKDKALQSMSFEQLIALFKNKPLGFTPGEKMSYSNSNYVLLGAIIEKISGKTHEQFLHENIFSPFGMHSSGCNYYAETRPQATLSYCISPHIPANFDLSGAGDGSIYSTVEDLYRYDRALKLFAPTILEQLFAPWYDYDVQTPGIKVSYGYGWVIDQICGHKRISHDGGINGFAALITRFIDDDMCVIILCNTLTPACERIHDDVATLIFTGTCEKPYKTWSSWFYQWCAAHALPRWIAKKIAHI